MSSRRNLDKYRSRNGPAQFSDQLFWLRGPTRSSTSPDGGVLGEPETTTITRWGPFKVLHSGADLHDEPLHNQPELHDYGQLEVHGEPNLQDTTGGYFANDLDVGDEGPEKWVEVIGLLQDEVQGLFKDSLKQKQEKRKLQEKLQAQKANHGDQVKELERKLKQLETHQKDTAVKCAELEQQLEGAKSKAADAVRQLDIKSQTHKKAMTELENGHARTVKELENGHTRKVKELQDEIQKYTETELGKRFMLERSKYNDTRQGRDTLQQTVQRLNRDLIDMEEEAEERKAEISEKTREIQTLRADSAALKQKYESAEAKLTDAKGTLANELAEQAEGWRDERQALLKEVNDLKLQSAAERRAHKSELDDLAGQLARREKENEQLQKTVSGVKEIIGKLEGQ
ncbi:hypothetical protein B0T16DRAFT_414315 [Cercophora newfieldiana]|uniref:Uncharacterized protein n=1 Tax=Cercophora newfieldiana TaxID=92897 RepID=A0AA40CRT8_9PEZI|nr:hypothetical protein B0T16DRAFT_414315 [Cercophora newfieldiana]